MMGMQLMNQCNISNVIALTHKNFASTVKYLEEHKEEMHKKAEELLIVFLQKYFDTGE